MAVADEAANAEFFGYPAASRDQSAFPQARVPGLVECGTHAMRGCRHRALRAQRDRDGI